MPPAPPPKEVGGDTHIIVSGCSHQVVGTIVNGKYVRTGENHGKPVYKKTEQTKDGVDVHIYFWDDKASPTFCGWWFGPRVGAEEVWAYNPGRMLGTAPLGGWKVPYDGPVDTNFTISVDRLASDEDRRLKKEAAAKQQAEAARASRQIRAVVSKLATVKIETLETLEEELTAVLEKELEACGPEKDKVKEECDKALEQAKSKITQQKEAKALFVFISAVVKGVDTWHFLTEQPPGCAHEELPGNQSGVKVIVAGFAKSGTRTICHALNDIGINAYHSEDFHFLPWWDFITEAQRGPTSQSCFCCSQGSDINRA
ncbi:ACC1 [Symbiodinium pilosum]|uniref:ACC1 protein n=1 Tax=Symbiodinium pilosum TaxID=2952 RepID=A0A812PFU7_SYMPI|nr:ACC1 [Symbiodinium pilosum]